MKVTISRSISVAISFFILMGVLLWMSPCVKAESSNENASISEIDKGQLITDLLETAVSDHFWREDNPSRTYYGAISDIPFFVARGSREIYETRYPFLSKFLQMESLPKASGINKWNSDITISLGWPEGDFVKKRIYEEELVNLIKANILHTSSILSRITGLNIEFVGPDDEKAKYSNFRIILHEGMGIPNFFKQNRTDAYLSELENNLYMAKRFTPLTRSQVEGYFVPNQKNEIEFSVCKFDERISKKLFGALLTECLVRGLGLPEVSVFTDNAVLGNWNAANDRYSFRPIFDGETKFGTKRLPAPDALSQETYNLENGPSEYDLQILNLLYCPKIEPGMDKYEVALALQDNQCFENKK